MISKVRTMHKRLNHSHFLPIASRKIANFSSRESESSRSASASTIVPINSTTHVGEILQCIHPGQIRVKREVARYVTDVPTYLYRVSVGV